MVRSVPFHHRRGCSHPPQRATDGWRVAAATAAGVVLTLAQVPAGAAAADSPAAAAPVAAPSDETSVAAAKARETGKRVELTSKRDATSTTYINPDATTTVETTETPTRVKQDGQWVDIDPSLSERDGVLTPGATKADVAISDGVGSEPLAQVSSGSKSLALDWATDLPRATVDGAQATFDAGADKDVRVSATNGGFNLHVVLDQAPTTAPVYRLPVTAQGVRLVATEGGGFAANDSSGKTAFRIAPPVAWDHTQDHLEAGPEETVPVQTTITEDTAGHQVLELRPSMEWLSDPARVYPVTVDPDVYLDSAGMDGTYVASNTPAGRDPSRRPGPPGAGLCGVQPESAETCRRSIWKPGRGWLACRAKSLTAVWTRSLSGPSVVARCPAAIPNFSAA
jgi:hypothetical protein